MSTPGDITMLLQQAENGDSDAADQLFRMVQEDLRAIAKKRRQGFPKGIDASTTILVNEAFVRLVGQNSTPWQAGDRKKFFSFAATKIHNYLVNSVRGQEAEKRGGDRKQVEWEKAEVSAFDADSFENQELLIDLKTALDEFHEFAEEDAILFRIRYFLGCTFEETAEIMGVSVTEAKRSFNRAKLWLKRELRSYDNT